MVNGADTAWILTATALVLFMTLPGLALFYAGLVRARNILSVLMQCVGIAALMSVLWLVAGYSLAFAEGTPWVGSLGKMMLAGVERGTVFDGTPLWLEIRIKDAGSPDPFIVLSPRQPVTSTSLIPAAGMQASSSTPASFLQVQSQNQNGNISAASASAPLFHNRSPGMAKRIGHDQIQTGSGGNGGGEGLVRFDDEDGGGESTDSDLEDEHVVEAANSNGEEDDLDSDLDNPRFMLRRRR